ncbi:MAG: lysophospholipid acyltransferase family protein [Planctomycetota bacterium]
MNRYQGFKLVSLLSLRLPRRALYFMARIITSINYRLDRAQREGVLANLRVILGPTASEKRIRRDSRLAFYNFGKFLGEFFGFERFGGPFIDEHVDVVGEEHLQRALAGGKGVIMNAGHLSNWEIGAATLARRGHPVMGVALPHPDPALNDFVDRQRRSRGYDVVRSEGAYRKCMLALKRNEVVCLMGDRDVGMGSIEIEFFGRPTFFPQGPARIALTSGAPVLPAFVIRRLDDSFVLHIEPPVVVPGGGSRRERAQAMTQEFANTVERYVRLFPTQWAVFYKYWPEEGEAVVHGADM